MGVSNMFGFDQKDEEQLLENVGLASNFQERYEYPQRLIESEIMSQNFQESEDMLQEPSNVYLFTAMEPRGQRNRYSSLVNTSPTPVFDKR